MRCWSGSENDELFGQEWIRVEGVSRLLLAHHRHRSMPDRMMPAVTDDVEAERWSDTALDPSMILLNVIIDILVR